MSKYRILSFDGGGIRGVLSAKLLQRLNIFFPDLIEKVDLFAGTSTGSFIALGLAYGLSPDDLVNLYKKYGKYIFSPKYTELFRPKYDNKHLKKTLSKIFPTELKLKDLKKAVLIPSFRITTPEKRWKPVFFNNFTAFNMEEEYVIDVALSSSAAPIYFPSYNQHIDGGIIANNPSTAAISIAIDKYGANQDIDEVYLLSIGTGYNPIEIKQDTSNWGFLQWQINSKPLFPLVNIMLDGAVEADVYFSSQLLRGRYFRLNPQLDKMIELDNYKEIDYLLSLADDLNLEHTIDWIKNNWV